MREDGLQFLHINRDGITGDLFHEHSINPRGILTQENRETISRFLRIGEQRYYESLEREFAARTPHVIIDYPPGVLGGKWISDTIALSKKAGRKIVIEGLSADPIVTLPRVLQRSSKGVDLSCQGIEMMNPNRKYFENWLQTYKNFPEQFLRAAQIVDEAHLYDTGLQAPALVADWQNGQLSIKDQTAFERFSGLANINPETARFDASVTDTQTQNGILVHSFAVSTSGFYGLNYSDAPAAPAPKIAKASQASSDCV